jgi:TPR repeat protein/DNA-binding transcriptional ArsR family regulator
LIGQRGQGKTTLLRRILIEVKNDNTLSGWMIAVKFTEEQYHIRTLGRLWEEIADILQNEYPEYFPDIADAMEAHSDKDDYDDFCFDHLIQSVRQAKKKLLLLIDNIDDLLNRLTLKEQRRLREILTTASSFRIIGGSSKMLEQHFNYGMPFYEFFRIEKLGGFSSDETKTFLRALAQENEKKKIESIITKSPQRIELLRRLTGGVPRTIIMLFDVFMDDDGGAFNDLVKILDEVTPLYKHRMDDLPTQLQDIVHTIAMNWDGMGTKEIAKKTNLESKAVSAQLKLLEKNELIISEAIGKNKIYQIKERFFNIWYLMRFGRKRDRQRVEWLVKFLESWCNPDELKNRAERLIASLKTGGTQEYHAYHLSESLCYAGLDMDTENELKQATRDFLMEQGSSLCNEVSPSNKERFEKARALYESGKFEESLKVLGECRVKDDRILRFKAGIYYHLNQYENAIQSISDIQERGKSDLYHLGWIYCTQKKYKAAEKQYRLAIKKGSVEALNNLANLYNDQNRFEDSEHYYLLAIEKGAPSALNDYAWFLFKRAKEPEKALELITKDYTNRKVYANTHTCAVIQLWNDLFQESATTFIELLAHYPEAVETKTDVTEYLLLLMGKKQYYHAKNLFELPEYQLKERYKPIWYALTNIMGAEMTVEAAKMGSELKESVDEILQKIQEYQKKYLRSFSHLPLKPMQATLTL